MIQAAHTVLETFAPISGTYEMVNHVLTFGLDRYWRRQAARRAVQPNVTVCLDACTGTGEMAMDLCRAGRGRLAVTAVDFCEPMIRAAARKSKALGIVFQLANAADLPFPDNHFDLVTISFALRNLNVTRANLSACLAEFRRVLRNGGRLLTLETTQPPIPAVRRLLHGYARTVVPRIGAILSGSRPAYAYLSGTIPRFYSAPELAGILCDAGFTRVQYTYLTFGLVAIHEAVKAPVANG